MGHRRKLCEERNIRKKERERKRMKARKTEKEPLERSRHNSPQSSHRTKNSLYYYQMGWKDLIIHRSSRLLRKALPQ
jgi:hypothetical protein